jgi:hypothetical protein
MWLLIWLSLKTYMVVNFKTRGISWGTRKLIQTPVLIIIIINYSGPCFHSSFFIYSSILAKCEPHKNRIYIELQRVQIQIDNYNHYHKELMDYTKKFYFLIYLINYFFKIFFFYFKNKDNISRGKWIFFN